LTFYVNLDIMNNVQKIMKGVSCMINPKHLEQLRQFINSDNWPLDIDDWPCEVSSRTNCLAFALGLPYPDMHHSLFTIQNYPFSDAKTLLELFLKELNLVFRKIDSIEEAHIDEYILQVYERKTANSKYFHVIRRNLDGKWVHKPGWNRGPCEITFWEYFYRTNPKTSISVTFAVKKREP